MSTEFDTDVPGPSDEAASALRTWRPLVAALPAAAKHLRHVAPLDALLRWYEQVSGGGGEVADGPPIEGTDALADELIDASSDRRRLLFSRGRLAVGVAEELARWRAATREQAMPSRSRAARYRLELALARARQALDDRGQRPGPATPERGATRRPS